MTERYSDSRMPKDFIRMKQIKAELDTLTGKIIYELKRDKDGKIIRKPYTIKQGARKGEVVDAIEYDTTEIKERIPGIISELSSKAQRLKEASDLGRRFSERTFDNFDCTVNKKACDDARAYADMENLFENPKNCRIIIGGIGTGKTHLASAITNKFCERNIDTLFATYEQHLQRLKDEMDNTSQRTYLAKMKTASVLVLDDVGREIQSDWARSVMYSVINYRYEHMFPTIITTNYDDDTFMQVVGRDVASRLYESSLSIRTYGEDYRKKMRSLNGN